MARSQLLWMAAGSALAITACAPALHEHDVGFAPAPAGESTLIVRNDYFGEMDIFVITGATRARLGSVHTGGRGNFRLPRALLARQEVQFQLDPVGPEGPFTYRPISVEPGNVVELAVAPMLQMSSYAIVLNP